jgi:hypothetical protein
LGPPIGWRRGTCTSTDAASPLARGFNLYWRTAAPIVIEIWESREAQEADMPKLGAAIQKTGLQEKPMRANWSKLKAHAIPDKAISGGTVEAQGRASSATTPATT